MFGKSSRTSVSKSTNKLSAVGVVEELFEEGSAMLAERYILITITLPLKKIEAPIFNTEMEHFQEIEFLSRLCGGLVSYIT